MNKIIYSLSMVVVAMAVTGCSVFKSNTTAVTGDDAVKTSTSVTNSKKASSSKNKHQMTLSNQMLDGEWTISEVNGRKVTGEERPYMTFSTSDGRIYGSNGCNIINGDYNISDSGNTLTFTNVITTQRACADAPFEYEINQALDKVKLYSVEKKGNEYYLSLLNGNHRIMVLRKHNMDFLNGAWKVKNVKGKKVDNENVQLVIDIPELKLHGNTGCNILNGSLWIDPDKTYSIQFQQIGTTRMMCDEKSRKVETALLVALEEVESARKDGDKVKMYDKDGNKILELSAISAD